MAKPDPERRAKTRSHIIDSFWQLYDTHPLAELKVRSVTSAASCNRSTFYEYFDSMDDLLEQAEDDLIAELLAYFQEVVPDASDAGALGKATCIYECYGERLSALMGPDGDPAFPQKFRDALKPFICREFSLDLEDPRSDIAAECVLGAMAHTLAYWYRKGRPISAEELAQMLRSVMDHGVLSLLRRDGASPAHL